VAHCAIIDPAMEEVMANSLVPQRLKCVADIREVALMHPLPINEISPAGAALAALVRRHLFKLLEAVQVVVTINGRALDFERRGLLKFCHGLS
jgi:hypothetical protein